MKKFFKRFRTVLELDKDEKKLFRQAFFLLASIRIRMVFNSFPRVLAWVRKKTPSVEKGKRSDPERLAWMVESTGIAFPHTLKCLPRALAGFILLRRCGWEVTLKIGTRRRKQGSPIEAHAWLEREGRILIGDLYGLDDFAVFETFEGQFL